MYVQTTIKSIFNDTNWYYYCTDLYYIFWNYKIYKNDALNVISNVGTHYTKNIAKLSYKILYIYCAITKKKKIKKKRPTILYYSPIWPT